VIINCYLRNSLAMALHHLPSHGWRVIYQVELRKCSSMDASLTSDIYSAVALREVAFGH
jgi:hypothetical protein